jgi:phage-related protein
MNISERVSLHFRHIPSFFGLGMFFDSVTLADRDATWKGGTLSLFFGPFKFWVNFPLGPKR